MQADENTTPIEVLVRNQRQFLGFLERRVSSPETARDILQRAFVTGLEKEKTLRDSERVVPWFYRLLRNAVIDHYRHAAAEKRALESFGFEPANREMEPDLERQICSCIAELIQTLRPEQADLIREIDLGDEATATVAKRRRITPNALRVRLHRARRTLRKALIEVCGTCAAHGCLDCSCRTSDGPQPS